MTLSSQDISAATQAILQHQKLLIVPHANVDPDGLSSALACFQLFQAIGKDVTVICPDTPPESLKFLPGFEKLENEVAESENFIITVNLEDGVEVDKMRYTVEDQRVNIIVVPKKGRIRPRNITFGEGDKRYDLIVVVDTADLALLGSLYTQHVDLFSDLPILNVDHHISNVRYGQMQLIDATAASATEVLFQWFMHVPDWRTRITPDIATLLLTGLITDTRSFQNPNTTPRSLEVAAELLEKGARQQEIIQHIYKTKPLSTLKIWGRALNRIQMDTEVGIVWSTISKEDLQEMDAKSKETHGILDELISTIPNADVHVLFTEMEDGGLKASLRSSAAIDASKLAAETYDGGGHARAAGLRVRNYSNFQLQVLECVQKLKEGMQNQRRQSEGMTQPVAAVPAAPRPADEEVVSVVRAEEVKIAPQEERVSPPRESRRRKDPKSPAERVDREGMEPGSQREERDIVRDLTGEQT
ncbi:MAG: bifunctional oligoribonuclease/PAP phosphatase NrnA [Candidatus Peregrinibacteria bacterium]|nr:bifunctional oligoribonuclease/PAP phosphatase NrnA [Candidatus Peregrinibacteria bacterium]